MKVVKKANSHHQYNLRLLYLIEQMRYIALKSTSQIIEEVKKEIPEVSVEEAQKEKTESGDDVVLLDVRDEDEYRAGYIPDAVHVTRGMLEFSIEDEVPDRDKRVIVYCAAGMRSLLAAKSLRELGYTDSVSMAGGYRDWSASGLPTAKDKEMTPDQLERYSRHFMLTEVGERDSQSYLTLRCYSSEQVAWVRRQDYTSQRQALARSAWLIQMSSS